MKNDIRLYGNTFDPKVIKDVKELNEKIEKSEDPEERLKLYTQRLYRGMELNAGLTARPWGGYYPY
jgi:hypothetical protein